MLLKGFKTCIALQVIQNIGILPDMSRFRVLVLRDKFEKDRYVFKIALGKIACEE